MAKAARSTVGPTRKKTGGRTKGTPNKLTASVKGAITEAFDELGGVASLVTWGQGNQDAFYALWGRLAPTEVTADVKGQLTIRVVKE